jgi:putative phage-type endonuclease
MHMTQQTQEWHNLRRSMIGASDAPAIMGISPWKTEYQLWLEKLGLYEQESTWYMKRGLDKEEEARQAFKKETGIKVFPDVVFSKDYQWMMASLDGIDLTKQHVLEIKCAGKEDHECAMDGEVPKHYYPQLQHQMIVCNVNKMFYFSYSNNSQKVLEVYRDNNYNVSLIENEKNFMKCLDELIPPKLSNKDFVKKNDDLWNQTAKQWLDVNQQLKLIEKKEKELRDNLINMSGQSNAMGAGIKLSKIVRKGSIKYNEIPAIKNVNLEEFRSETTVSFRISKNDAA